MSNESTVFKMPTVGIESVRKIIGAYAAKPDMPSSLEDISGKSGIHSTDISLNSGFLIGLGIISGGKSKALTEDGKQLAFNFIHKSEKEEKVLWMKLLLDREEVNSLITYLRLNDNISIDDFQRRIKTNLQLKDSKRVHTGVNCLVEILKFSGLIETSDDKVKLLQLSDEDNIESEINSKPNRTDIRNRIDPNININIQIHLSPGASEKQIEQVFVNMKKLFNE